MAPKPEKDPVRTLYTVLSSPVEEENWRRVYSCEATSTDAACRMAAQKMIAAGAITPPFQLVAVPNRSFRPVTVGVKVVEPQLTLTPVVDGSPEPSGE